MTIPEASWKGVRRIAILLFLSALAIGIWQTVSIKGALRPRVRPWYQRWKGLRSVVVDETHRIERARVAVTVEPEADRRPISPLIYGVAHAPADSGALRALGIGLHRWGGNPNTRYNWVLNAWNAARDWEWRNYGEAGKPPSAVADAFVRQSRAAGSAVLVTVPAMGWVAGSVDKEARALGVPARGGAALPGTAGAIAGYDPHENRRRTSVASRARKGRPFERSPRPGGMVYQDEWVHHLVTTFGPASGGGVRFYAVDNEPDLWSVTHTDVHPARMGYEDVLSVFLEYANAIKDVDPSAQVTGPVAWGWTGYLYSALDEGEDRFGTQADRKRHGDEPFLLWFLKQVRARDEARGRRSLDVLDIHHYPQAEGVHSEHADPATQARRLRATRAWWDPTYGDESWIGEAQQVLPRMKSWIAQGYPGTRLGVSEWNFGGEQDISGGLAAAETLGIFGREGVYLASFWTCPRPGSYAWLAFGLFRAPYGSARAQFGDLSCRASSANPSYVSSFAAMDTREGALSLLLINKLPRAVATVPLEVRGWGRSGPARLLRFSAGGPRRLVMEDGPALQSGKATITLPPYSATLLRFSYSGSEKI